ncbi:MAG: hypothetical protein QNK35_03645, partial [Bacteroides sp.]|nr:hypothetical protein [Bacteroides sp.]
MTHSHPFKAGQNFSSLAVILLLVGVLGSCKKNDPEPQPSFTFETVTERLIHKMLPLNETH